MLILGSMRLPATTINEVLSRLDEIIDTALAKNDPNGYFAYIYRRTTRAVKEAIEAGRFADNARMEVFDVAFANLYLEAYEQHQCVEQCSASSVFRKGLSLLMPWCASLELFLERYLNLDNRQNHPIFKNVE
ncbi:hypothetical protein SAMN05444359_1166 [Neolewinella agarilytica]|uniref:Uncharacterized protein n=2 Tax=Neolewinella agarilytica TaxID=478744 RepID=A0A1H9IXQ8_9BACT|nr:hypothetical protein SAMN05444359_1166 [Neolewinella agarilytica]